KWLHDQVGTNWRMLEISAAIGLRQLTKLPEWRRLRSRNARILADALRDVPGIVCWMPPDGVTHAYYKFYSYLDPVPDVRSRRSRIIARLGEEGVKAFTGSCSEVYLEKAFEDLGIESLPIARQLGATSLMFEVHPTLDPHLLSER